MQTFTHLNIGSNILINWTKTASNTAVTVNVMSGKKALSFLINTEDHIHKSLCESSFETIITLSKGDLGYLSCEAKCHTAAVFVVMPFMSWHSLVCPVVKIQLSFFHFSTF